MPLKQKFVLALCLLGAVKAYQEVDVKEEDSNLSRLGLVKNLLSDFFQTSSDYQTSFNHPSSNEIDAKEEDSNLFRLSLFENLLSDAYATFNHTSLDEIYHHVTPLRRQAVSFFANLEQDGLRRQAVSILTNLGQDGMLALLALVS